MSDWYGAIEAGGTKWLCAVTRGPGETVAETRFPTTTPAETLARAIQFFQGVDQPLEAIGVASFGPVDLAPESPTYGFITATPKAGWSDTDVVGPLRTILGRPVAFDTDVNAAALGEARWGAAQGLDTFLYLTIGTGIGGGGMVGGQLMHGLVHPEIGHIRLPHDRERDPFEGNCPFHGDCLEGLASGPAIATRWGVAGDELPEDHPAWALEAHYLALALATLVCTVSPQRLILGGGVMAQRHLFPPIRSELQKLLAGYVAAPEILERIDEYVVPPGLGDQAGIMGALALAQRLEV